MVFLKSSEVKPNTTPIGEKKQYHIRDFYHHRNELQLPKDDTKFNHETNLKNKSNQNDMLT
jgi:hypothetical protein